MSLFLFFLLSACYNASSYKFINNHPTLINNKHKNQVAHFSMEDKPNYDNYKIEELKVKDFPNIFTLANQQFEPKCTSFNEKYNLKFKIFKLFLTKLIFPSLMGHRLLGLKLHSSNELIGMIDVSLQRCDSSLNALTPQLLFVRRKNYDLKPYICNFLVAESYRRKGLGKLLIKSSEDLVKDWGYKDIYLHVESSSLPALCFYISQNFEIIKTLEDSTVLFMRKHIIIST